MCFCSVFVHISRLLPLPPLTSMMAPVLLLLLGAIFLVSSLSVLTLNKSQRNVVLDRLHIRRRRTSGARTPPRSLSPDRKDSGNGSNSSEPDFTTAFPPSRRHVLAEIPSALPSILGKSAAQLAESPSDSRTNLQPFDVHVKDLTSPKYTATEFSTAEIKALGNFPDYAALSGVRLPEPYTEFDINKAKPRPYRPFRWNYHQTMCK